jgi:urease accessory protein
MDRARAALRERDDRIAASVGRDARLDLTFERRGGRTVLTRAYCEPPLRVGRVLDLDGAAYVILVCAGPGVFAGDRLRQTVRLGSGARVVLTSQSALQVHPGAASAPAIVEHRYRLDEDAELHCHWDPVIPFADARLAQRVDLRMPSSARLWWSDALMAGRVSRGERWQFHELAHELRLHVDDSLAYLERYRIAPDERRVMRAWTAGDAAYTATALVHHDRASADSAAWLHEAIACVPGARGAADLVEARVIVARLVSAEGSAFAAARALCRRFTLESIFQAPQLAGRKSV